VVQLDPACTGDGSDVLNTQRDRYGGDLRSGPGQQHLGPGDGAGGRRAIGREGGEGRQPRFGGARDLHLHAAGLQPRAIHGHERGRHRPAAGGCHAGVVAAGVHGGRAAGDLPDGADAGPGASTTSCPRTKRWRSPGTGRGASSTATASR
jgi:hypothetical protein